MAKEQDIQSQITKLITTEYNGYVVKVVTATRSGVPDLLACIQGRFIAIEVKDVGKLNTTSPLQLHNIELITNSGGIALACDNPNELDTLLTTYFGTTDV